MSFSKDKILKMAKGFQGRGKNCYRVAKQRVEKSLLYSYRDRRVKKRVMRALWISQVNAGTRLYGMKYSQFIHGLQKQNIKVDRRTMAELAQFEPLSFRALTLASGAPAEAQQLRLLRKDINDYT